MAAEIIVDINDGNPPVFQSEEVVGHVLVAVIHCPDGTLAIERCVGVNVEDYPEDGETVTAFIQAVEKKLNEALPQEEPTPKIWLPE